MPVFEKVLVPVDLTRKNVRAAEIAREIALQSGGEVGLLHVIEPLDLPFEELEDFYEDLEAKAREAMTELAAKLGESGMEPTMYVTYGERAREIVDFADREGFDLVVLTSHVVDPAEPRRRDLGTISHKVALLAPMPVLLVR